MRVGVPVNYISSVKSVLELCPQYEKTLADIGRKRPFSFEDSRVLNVFLTYAKMGCFREMDSILKSVSEINDAEPLIELAGKISQAAAPFVNLCKDGVELIKRQKEDPKEGPRASHWLAIHLNELNYAFLQINVESDPAKTLAAENAIKEAIRKICYFQDYLVKLPKEQVAEEVWQLYQLCENRMNQIDPKGLIREELKKSFWEANITPYLPQVLTLFSEVAFYMLKRSIAEAAIRQGGLPSALYLSYLMADSGANLISNWPAPNLLSIALNGNLFYNCALSLQK